MFSINYNFGVVNIPEKYIHKCKYFISYFYGFADCVPMSDYFFGYFASIISVGGFFGSFISVYMCHKFGRRKSLIYNNFIFITGGLLVSLVNNKYIMLSGRLVIGLASGVAQAVSPMYVAEIATIKSRGALGLLLPILGDVGNISSLLFGLFFSDYFIWRILLGIIIIPGLLQLLALLYCVETPRYFIVFKKDNIRGANSLQKIRKGCIESAATLRSLILLIHIFQISLEDLFSCYLLHCSILIWRWIRTLSIITSLCLKW